MAVNLLSIEAELRKVATNLAEIFHELEKYKPREPRVIYLVVEKCGIQRYHTIFESEEIAGDMAAGIPGSKVVKFVEILK